MTLAVKLHASIEGQVLRLLSRKPAITPIPILDKIFGMTYPFRLQQNSEAEIHKESDPKVAKFDKGASLNLGDAIRAATISGFSTKPLPACRLIQATGAHKGNETKCKDFGYAKIDIPLRNELERMAKEGSTPDTPSAQLLPAPK